MTLSKSGLAIILSRLESFTEASAQAEQYPTDSEVAAEVLWQALMQGDIAGKRVADLGCGTGILAVGAALLGASSVVGVDSDASALEVAGRNVSAAEKAGSVHLKKRMRLIQGDIAGFSEQADTVVQNPPFGTAREHADRVFLGKAFSIAPVVWSFHKESTGRFVERFAADSGFAVTHHLRFAFPLKRSRAHHTRRIHRIEVGCWRFSRMSEESKGVRMP